MLALCTANRYPSSRLLFVFLFKSHVHSR